MSTYAEIRKKIEQLEQEAAEAKAFEDRLKANDPKAIAEVLHSRLCHANHTDQCSYGYESWNNFESGYEKKRYYSKAKRLIALAEQNNIDVPKILEIFDEVNKL